MILGVLCMHAHVLPSGVPGTYWPVAWHLTILEVLGHHLFQYCHVPSPLRVVIKHVAEPSFLSSMYPHLLRVHFLLPVASGQFFCHGSDAARPAVRAQSVFQPWCLHMFCGHAEEACASRLCSLDLSSRAPFPDTHMTSQCLLAWP